MGLVKSASDCGLRFSIRLWNFCSAELDHITVDSRFLPDVRRWVE